MGRNKHNAQQGSKRDLNDLNDSMIQFSTPKRVQKETSSLGAAAGGADARRMHSEMQDVHDDTRAGKQNQDEIRRYDDRLADQVSIRVKQEIDMTVENAVTKAVNKAFEIVQSAVNSAIYS
jgi:capsule polysaccharide export protein KpsC/LpsZ